MINFGKTGLMSKIIDLRSDTITRPSPAMLEAMFNADVGDDVFGDDPTVNKLEEIVAKMFGKDGALFCPSGTMTNQIAVSIHTRPGDEVICEQGSHVYRYEGGGMAYNSGCSIRLVQGDRGRINASDVLENINPDNIHFPRTSLVVVENTSNRGGGSYYRLEPLVEISQVCRENNLSFHLDGARLFNALVETNISSQRIGDLFDSVSICLSKGLGAPVGSILTGDSEFIKEARRKRKVMGGGMRQAGYLAAAGIYAIQNNIERLREDHRRASFLRDMLMKHPFVNEIGPVETNILKFTLSHGLENGKFLGVLAEEGLLAIDFGPHCIRMVTHLDFSDEDLTNVEGILKRVSTRLSTSL
jgi:threonine aldolase